MDDQSRMKVRSQFKTKHTMMVATRVPIVLMVKEGLDERAS